MVEGLPGHGLEGGQLEPGTVDLVGPLVGVNPGHAPERVDLALLQKQKRKKEEMKMAPIFSIECITNITTQENL